MRLKTNIFILLFFVVLFILSSCRSSNQETTITLITAKDTECKTDLDCSAGGCSNQICGEREKIREIITTCEYKQEYECLKFTNCGCVNNKCLWKENNEYLKCLKEKRQNEV